ncbi:phosphopantetheine-binding protein [Streptomyces sp. NPDC051563]|uniref:phosphopantetheine-binding protein n=1 Tax=Streptomyces sp. NPDC051563 TaxID=3365659 RepID=UPI003799C5B4
MSGAGGARPLPPGAPSYEDPSRDAPEDAAGALLGELAGLVSRSTDGLLGVRELLDSTAPLTDLGVSSLSLLRLVDAAEGAYGVFVDLGDRTLYTEGLRGLAERLVRLGAVPLAAEPAP